jgi:CRISPR-associated endonuclease/helicase Cas3
VVDEATEHAERIAKRLREVELTARRDGTESVLARVAAGLRRLGGTEAGDGPSLAVTRMRGGTTWSSAWAERPDRPGIVIGTVDQVGSRLLFRGYGVGDRRRPIDAALVGMDALLLVDEAHLATALLRTVHAASARDRTVVPLPGLDVVRLTATARRRPVQTEGAPASAQGSSGGTAEAPSRCDAPFLFDREAHLATSTTPSSSAVWEADRRLRAAKRLALLEVPTARVVPAMADLAIRLTTRPGSQTSEAWRSPTVLVVCNTVDRAREVHAALQTQAGRAGTDPAFDLWLLIGRSRPVDRAGLEHEIKARFGLEAEASRRPAVLVSTQTIEVGVNLDADALVTESASWDALVQRLGRLNRLGRYQERFPGAGAAPAVVVHDGRADGPVYGSARDRTWQHLCTLVVPSDATADVLAGQASGVGVSPLECRELAEAVPGDAFMPEPDSPIVTSPILDRWASTAPVPTVDPPIEPYLHGFDSGSPSVALAWREGLLAADRSVDLPSGPVEDRDEWVDDLLTAIQLRATEQIEVPLAAVRRWVAGQPAGSVSDLESAPDDDLAGKQTRDPFTVWVRRDDAERGARWRLANSQELRPGDIVVVPGERGGADAYGWNPQSVAPATDVSEAAAVDAGRLLLRIDAGLGERLGIPVEAGDDFVATIAALVAALEPDGLDDPDVDTSPRDATSEGSTDTTPMPLRVRALTVQLLRQLRDGLHAAPASTAAAEWLHEPRRARLLGVVGKAADAGGSPSAPHPFVVGDAEASGRSGGPTVVLTWRPPLEHRANGSSDPGLDRDDDDPSSSSIGSGGVQVTLDQHLTNVRARAVEISEHLGLDAELTAVLADAAGWHDLGKIEARFQAMLHGGDPYAAAIADKPLAKSGMDPSDRRAWREARDRSGLHRHARHARHEAWSAALVREYLAERRRTGRPYPGDEGLVLHLVASHHGHARPLLPLVVDTDPRVIDAVVDDVKVQAWSADTVDIGHPDRFAALNERYGRWGLALLETIVRCADMTVSAEGS